MAVSRVENFFSTFFINTPTPRFDTFQPSADSAISMKLLTLHPPDLKPHKFYK